MSNTGYVFSFAIGLIFLFGGILFLAVLDENRYLFGIPYTVMGLLIVVGLHQGRKRRLRREAEEAALLGDSPDPGERSAT